MEATELLHERATSLLELMKDSSLRCTIPNLAAAAKRNWPKLNEKEQDEIANAALRLKNGGPVTGEGPVPTGPDGTTNADWPVRTVARPKAETPPMPAPSPTKKPAPPAREGTVKHTNGSAPIGGRAAREFLRTWIPEHPEGRAEEAWDALQALGEMGINKLNFETNHWYAVRRTLKDEGKIPAGPKRSGQKTDRPAAPPAKKKDRPAASSPPAGANGHTVPRPAPLPPARAVPFNVGTASTLEVPAARAGRDVIQISGGEDSFESSRQQDGAWRVRLEATVTEELMGQLAAIAWGGIMGPGAPA